MKKRTSNILLVIMFVVGAGIMSYPIISNLWNTHLQQDAISLYSKEVENIDPAEIERNFEKAQQYNAQLATLPSPLTQYEKIQGYEDIFDVDGHGMMGSIRINAIDVELPIYHTVSTDVLSVGVGHIPGTSFPIAGNGVHAALSAHTGLPSAKLFSNIDQLKKGDKFEITIMNQRYTYQVDQMKTVLPQNMRDLAIEPDKNYCTLVTCYPYGVNTHRLLVRGTLVANGEPINTANDHGIGYASVPLAILAALITLAILLIRNHYRKKTYYDKNDDLENDSETTKKRSDE